MSYLLDTNVISELRKGTRANEAVRRWYAGVPDEDIFLSVLVIGELRRGVESLRRRDVAAGTALDSWLKRVAKDHADRILPVTTAIAEAWGRFNVPDPLPVIDSLIAATAHVHRLVVATRNVRDIGRTGVPVINPFEESEAGAR